MRPFSAVHVDRGTPHVNAAAEISISRAVAPAFRIGSHVVRMLALPPVANAILASVPEREFYFGTRTGGPYNSWGYDKARLDARIKCVTGRALPRWTLHDIRRTIRTGLGRIGIQPHIAELVINHVKGGIQAVYDKHTYQREIDAALVAWAGHVLDLVEGRERKVMPIRAA